MFRRLRGVIGTALTWASGWSVAGAVMHGLATLWGWNGFLVPGLGAEIAVHAMMGFVGGAAFASGLLVSERHGSLAKLSIGRSASWGALAGLVGPLLVFFLGGDLSVLTLTTTWPLFLGTVVFGGASGAGMAAVAREGDAADLEQPPAQARLEGTIA